MQRTYNVDGHKIKVVTRQRVGGCHGGYFAHVSDNRGNKKRYSVNTLEENKAQERGYVRFIKEFC